MASWTILSTRESGARNGSDVSEEGYDEEDCGIAWLQQFRSIVFEARKLVQLQFRPTPSNLLSVHRLRRSY